MSGFEQRQRPFRFPKIATAMHVHLEKRGMTIDDLDDYLSYLHDKEHRWLAWEIEWLEMFHAQIDHDEVGRHLDPVLEKEGIAVTSSNDEMRWCLACMFHSAIGSIEVSTEDLGDILSGEEQAMLNLTHTAILPRPDDTGQASEIINTATEGDSQ